LWVVKYKTMEKTTKYLGHVNSAELDKMLCNPEIKTITLVRPPLREKDENGKRLNKKGKWY